MLTTTPPRAHPMPAPRAIQTRYNGYHFRSRIEARWAVFFDTLGLGYTYEPQGFILGGDPYLPDFYLTHQGAWVEIKGTWATKREQELCARLSAETGDRVFLFAHPIDAHARGKAAGEVYRDGRLVDDVQLWCECARCGARRPSHYGAANENCPCATLANRPHGGPECDFPWPDGAPSTHSPRIRAAYAAALSARFEHGETPTPPVR